ncbi:carbohydrate kinase family protein [Actinoallomurus iriomotensis]|uniref:Sugar kinase n=1 Tax=Actinoallomurus iriomotensis TaxID=478107 RepID=A0A9W6S5L5_9ACTN|nr:PfkB family carbohydrate kinase [Actinoallomurus iriomotensis]GLY88755.1 sugar kinase [Actinoallomurus iriomotensis]
MLLIVGEAIVAYQRDLGAGGTDTGQAFTGPWASGSPAIAAYVAARLGVDTRFVGGVGADEGGQVMRRAFERAGVGLEGLREVSGLRTASARITYRGDAHREFDFDVRGTAAGAVREADLGALPEHAGWVHLSGSALVFGDPLASTALAAFHRARRAGARTSVDPNVRPEALDEGARTALVEAIGHADVLLPSEGEMEALGLDPGRLAESGTTVCTTYGPGGAEVRERGSTTRLEAVPAEVVDADGAGDTFAAAFIAASIAGASPVAAAGAGVRVAARAIGVEGPMTAELDPRLLDGPAPVRR